MSSFKCEIHTISVFPHPDPETTALEVAKVGEFNIVVGKGNWVNGERCIYIPENAIVPQNILEELNLVGKLGGSNKDRVRPRKLRGIMSEGLVLKDKFPDLPLGSNVAEQLGIKKYEPETPAQMNGKMTIHDSFNIKFDIENYKAFPTVFSEDEEVVFTEKIHGTFVNFSLLADKALQRSDMPYGMFFISSKGQGAKGLYFTYTEENKDNVYVKTFYDYRIDISARNILTKYPDAKIITIMGEIYGVQKGYNYDSTNKIKGFKVFTIKIDGQYLNRDEFEALCKEVGLFFTPVLYRGLFSKDKLKELTDGKETVSGKGQHIREGVVITPVIERYSSELRGRAILKSISDTYLNKSTGEEFN